MSQDYLKTVPPLLKGKKGLITGIAMNRSISWAIAEVCAAAGAEIALSYQGQRLESNAKELARNIGSEHCIECDASDVNQSLPAMFEYIAKHMGKLDFLVHSIAFADRSTLQGRYLDVSQEHFQQSMNISCYSFTAMARMAEGLMESGGSLLTLSYIGAEKVVPNYNVMGVAKAALEASVRYIASDLGPKKIRVNAISAGPIKTLAASGIGDFHKMLEHNARVSPLRTNVSQTDVANSALFLLSDLSTNVTGEILHVDAGFHSVIST